MAKIGYGRIDYGLKDGRLQVWEISTNPTIVRRATDPSALPEAQRRLREPMRESFLQQVRNALETIGSEADPYKKVRIGLSGDQLRRLAAEKRAQRRRRV